MEDDVKLEDLVPLRYGPVWERNEDGTFILPDPKRTLGWDVLGWAGRWLNSFNGEGRLRLTNEQVRVILWWYAINDDGKFVYRRGVLQRLKGWGKDPLVAVMSIVEFLGPCRFGGWDADGFPIAVPEPNPLVLIIAVNLTQTRNTLSLLPILISDKCKAEYGVEMGQEIFRANQGRARLEGVTSSFRALEGKRPTFQVLNEIHHWVPGNQGQQMYETAYNNAGKMAGTGSRWLAVTNAFLPGEESVGEKTREAYEREREGLAFESGWFYDTIEADSRTPLTPEALDVVLPQIRGDATWLDIEQIKIDMLDTSISPARFRRMILNQVIADSDSLYDRADWDKLANGYTGEHLREGDKIVLGFDGGKSDDATALVAIRVSDGFIQPLLIEERPWSLARDDYWEVDKEKVASAVHEAHRKYRVVAFYADVSLWESYLVQWAAQYADTYVAKCSERNPIAWDMRGSQRRNTFAHEALMHAIYDGDLRHGGDFGPNKELNERLKRHVFNARRRENNVGVYFDKESRESKKKVDAYAALMLANTALNDVRQRPEKTERSGRGYFF